MLFGRGAAGDPEEERRAEESLRSIEAGGLPLAAQERLDKLREGGGNFFTSDLSTAEFLLIREAGFRPVTQVMGSCFYTVGWQNMPGSYGMLGGGFQFGGEGSIFELEAQTEAWQSARRLAIGRLREEALRAGADAVVGVRLKRGRYDWAHGLIEFVAVGTAVRSERYDLGDEPVLSTLSGQEFAKLYEAGYWPAGVVAGTTVTYAMTGWNQAMANRMFAPNQELGDFTAGFQAARHQAMQRLTREAHEQQASGIVALQLDVSQHEIERRGGNSSSYRDLIITVHALGTAIVALTEADPDIYLALPLNEESR